jgi:2'-5' RNA ligase
MNEKLFLLLICFAFLFSSTANCADVKVSEKINVFAVVSPNIEEAAIKASEALYEEQGLEAFPFKGYQVHCTLYMTQYPVGARDEVRAKIKRLAEGVREFRASTTGLEITSGNWFFINLERNRNLQALSDAVVKLISPLRVPSNFIPDWAKSMPNKVEYISKYGSPNVFDEFNPHLTLTASTDGEKLANFLEAHLESDFAQSISGEIIAIGYGIADRDGQIEKPIEIFPLRQK